MVISSGLGFSAWCVAQQDISVSARVDRQRVVLGDTIELSITVEGTQQATPPTVTADGFAAEYVGPATSISIINGQMSTSIAYRYLLLAKKEGALTIGPIPVEAGGRTLTTEPISVTVLPVSAGAQRAGQPPGALDEPAERPPPSVGDAMQLQLAVDKTTLYVNESVPARLQLLVGGIRVRGIDMPKLSAEGLLVKPLGQPKQSMVSVGGQPYTLLEFETAITPIRPGSVSLGPATITCEVLGRRSAPRRPGSPLDRAFDDAFFSDFFGQFQAFPVTVKAEPVMVEVLPLPEQGKPADFRGAIGRFTMDVSAVPPKVAAGEPVTVTMTIRGQGNLDTLAAPQLDADPAHFKIYEPQVRPSTDPAQKTFEQVLIPLDPSVREIPQAHFSVFDPVAGAYATLSRGPLPLTVTPAVSPQQSMVIDRPPATRRVPLEDPIGHDIVYIKEAPGSFTAIGWSWVRSPWWWSWAVSPLLLLGVSEGVRRHRLKLAADPGLARASGALRQALKRCGVAKALQRSGKIAESYEAVFRAIQRYVGDRFNIPSEAVTHAELDRYLNARGAPAEVVMILLTVIDRCDAARFAPMSVATQQAAETVQQAEQALKQLERWRPA
ncbi:MAG: protein BatD [Candidatus Omnitrophica bacterium]|nr:protein BatD [Candidatus Omnitrophota bacterium]